MLSGKKLLALIMLFQRQFSTEKPNLTAFFTYIPHIPRAILHIEEL